VAGAAAPADAGAAAAVAADQPPARRACLVLLGGKPVAVDVIEAREVVMLETTTPVPGAPASVVGVMNLRGSVLPVVEARPLLGLPVRPAVGRPRALVLADGDHRAAILIERVLGLLAFDEVQPARDGALGALGMGELPVDESGERATVLNAAGLLSAVRRAWNPLAEAASAVSVDAGPGAPALRPGA
jgi:purine-binding chemotaxis protein CheW